MVCKNVAERVCGDKTSIIDFLSLSYMVVLTSLHQFVGINSRVIKHIGNYAGGARGGAAGHCRCINPCHGREYASTGWEVCPCVNKAAQTWSNVWRDHVAAKAVEYAPDETRERFHGGVIFIFSVTDGSATVLQWVNQSSAKVNVARLGRKARRVCGVVATIATAECGGIVAGGWLTQATSARLLLAFGR